MGLVFLGQVLQGQTFGLGQKEGGEDTSQHEECEYLQDVLQESTGAANVDELGETDLGNDSTQFTRSGRDTMGSRPVSSWEDFTRDNESGGVWTEVLEKVGQTVEEDESFLSRWCRLHSVVTETHTDEDDGEHDETHELDGSTSPEINKGE